MTVHELDVVLLRFANFACSAVDSAMQYRLDLVVLVVVDALGWVDLDDLDVLLRWLFLLLLHIIM